MGLQDQVIDRLVMKVKELDHEVTLYQLADAEGLITPSQFEKRRLWLVDQLGLVSELLSGRKEDYAEIL